MTRQIGDHTAETNRAVAFRNGQVVFLHPGTSVQDDESPHDFTARLERETFFLKLVANDLCSL